MVKYKKNKTYKGTYINAERVDVPLCHLSAKKIFLMSSQSVGLALFLDKV